MNKWKMKLAKWPFLIWLAISGWLLSCNDDVPLDSPANVDNEVNQFVWQGLNLYYLWQEQVPDLLDTRFETTNDLADYLNDFEQPEILFERLRFQDDRFSWIVDDYVALDNSFQGISKSFGYEFRLARRAGSTDEIFGFIEYVVPNSPASEAQLERGDIFISINGAPLNSQNIDVFLQSDNYTLGFANFVNESFVPNGTTVELTAIELTENPILVNRTLDLNGTKVGYLVYNQFINNNQFHRELNSAFGTFKANGVTELVLDLRYNPGGSLTTTRILASMIYGAADASTVFGQIIYNSKLSDLDAEFTFFEEVPILGDGNEQIDQEPMNRLSIDRIFILTSGSTASASELIIAGLLPFMDVTLIGTTTIGKNVGSVTLYDSPEQGFLSNNVGEVNPNHLYAMQPIISQLANSQRFTDYINGFSPDLAVDELDYFDRLRPLGDVEEPLLQEALAIIEGSARIIDGLPARNLQSILDSRALKTHLQTTVLGGNDIPQPLAF